MHTPWYRQETSQKIISWLDGLRLKSPQWSNPKSSGIQPYSPYFFSVDDMAQRNFSVVPFHCHWIPSEDRTLNVFANVGVERIYATGFHGNTNSYCSSPLSAEAIEYMQNQYLGYCLNAPIDESFLALNTHQDYWLLAAPSEMLQDVVGQSLSEALDHFTDRVRGHEFFEAGQDFAESIATMYRRHNETLKVKKPY